MAIYTPTSWIAGKPAGAQACSTRKQCLWAPMPEREHPAEGAQDGAAAPAVRGTTAFDGAHAFDEPTDDREEQVQTQRATDEALHDANVRRPNDSGQCGPSPERPRVPRHRPFRSDAACSRSTPARICSRLTASALMSGIRTAPSWVNSDATRSQSRIITASANSPRSASISMRSAIA